MTRHWRQCALLFFVLLVLAACSVVDSQEEMVEVGAISTALILPTPSPEPSATELPTETATITPSPRPSPTMGAATSTPQPEIQLGSTRKNPDDSSIEVWVGEWVTPPLAEGFDAAHIVLENNQIHYRSEGLTQVWSSETKTWVFPEQFYSELGKVVPVSLMGGRLEIADQAAAWQAHQDMVLAWLNNPGNAEFLQAVYAKSNISWEDLQTTDESGQTTYGIKLLGLSGEVVWPQVIIVSNTGDVRYWTLADYIDDKATFGTKIDVSSPLWIVAGPQNWTEQGVSDFVDQRLDGSDTFGNSWSSHGLLLTPSGRLAWTAISKNPSSRFETSHIPLGGTSGTEINPDHVQAYVASTIKTYHSIETSTRSIRAIPLYAGTTEGITTANTSGANTIEEAYTILPDRIFRNIP